MILLYPMNIFDFITAWRLTGDMYISGVDIFTWSWITLKIWMCCLLVLPVGVVKRARVWLRGFYALHPRHRCRVSVRHGSTQTTGQNVSCNTIRNTPAQLFNGGLITRWMRYFFITVVVFFVFLEYPWMYEVWKVFKRDLMDSFFAFSFKRGFVRGLISLDHLFQWTPAALAATPRLTLMTDFCAGSNAGTGQRSLCNR